MSYWDTSALAKLYVVEPDSTVFQQHAARRGSKRSTARVAFWEMRRVALNREAGAGLKRGWAEQIWLKLDEDIRSGRLTVVEPSAATTEEFDRVMTGCYRRTPPLFLQIGRAHV